MKTLNNLKKSFYLIIILNISVLQYLQGQQLKTHFEEHIIPLNMPFDSISNFLTKTKKQALIKKDSTLLINTLITQSRFNRFKLNYLEAFSFAGEALFISEEYKSPLLIAKANEELGVLTYLYKQNEESESYFIKAHQLYRKLYKHHKIDVSEIYKSYYNLVLHYQRIADKENLQSYIDSCIVLSKKTKLPPIYSIFLDEKKASISEWNNAPNEALKLLKNAAQQLENSAPNSGLKNKDKKFLLIIYGRIAIIYHKKKDLNEAKFYFEKFAKIKGDLGETTFYKSFLYSRYAEVLKELNLFALAYEYEKKSNDISNALLNPRNEKNKGFLTIKNYYKEELIKKREQLNIKNLELAKEKEALLNFRITLFIILFLVIILTLIVRQRIKNLKFEKKQQNSKELLDVKNKELTTNTLQLIEKEQVIKQLSDFIKEANPGNKSKIILKTIERSSTSLWDSFNRRFNQLNKGFYDRLQEKVPDLSRADRKLCALIKLNFSGKEMAHLLGISLGSVHVARHRLRKKMKLERHQNLTSFITSI
ncbi:hypothetical protein MPF19_05925 [Polaribacter sp. Z014]|uniref:helix-turn-helix transcriptional regulator n=1 Tax=Polaribacter sp. Z014 TaxID=2927126 RepID=UPI0020206A0E|nr:hypothetical protein [Polaribacter sp. Z014]MCL7762949.1 hypothetical protein [Polaribacter sp. Z014]